MREEGGGRGEGGGREERKRGKEGTRKRGERKEGRETIHVCECLGNTVQYVMAASYKYSFQVLPTT